ncbi:putative thiamine transport system permease protein [Devosia enhydra]|uniref:Putative thiamine transport system permease protein n=1 Tax=Devosia enhydra TaxID=665118 RepID=A0A1K2HXU1_9HYPH|nr:putative thiamine transport system permease protein [Devosia enhydra]
MPVLAALALAWPALAGLAGLGWTLVSATTEAAGGGPGGFDRLAAEPGLGLSIWVSLWTGPAAAALSLAIVATIMAAAPQGRSLRWIAGLMAPAMAIPHAAAGFALAFLIAPSGFLIRLTGSFERPPDWLILNDPAGLSLLAGLVLKEVPFLLLMAIAILPQANPERMMQAAIALGHRPGWAFLAAVFPGIYRRIRLPVYAVVAFSGSVVDLAIILGPGTPAPLAPRVLGWLTDPDLSRQGIGAAGALLHLLVTLASLLLWRIGEVIVAAFGRTLLSRGWRGPPDRLVRGAGLGLAGLVTVGLLGGLVVLGLWSVAGPWRFPDPLPQGLTLDRWAEQAGRLAGLGATSLWLALGSAAVSLILAILLLARPRAARLRMLILIPGLIVPQIAFLGGLAVLMLRLGWDGTLISVIAVHVIFVLPYMVFALAGPWQRLDPRHEQVALALGKSPAAAFWRVRLPMLAVPLAFAFALGCAISLSQYLPTLLIGGGRVATLTTEAVALASGGDRRLIGIYALAQTLLPALLLGLALLGPAALFRNRRGLLGGGEA